MFDNVTLKGMFVSKNDEGPVGWRNTSNEENWNFYNHSLAIIVRITKRLEFAHYFMYYLLNNFHIRAVHFDIIKVFY